MVIYIPNHLKTSIPILKSLSDMIVEYNKSYPSKSLNSFDDYYSYYSINTIKRFIELCLEGQENSNPVFKNRINYKDEVINYLVKLFYSVKGTFKVFEYMEKYLGIEFQGGINNVKYTINEVIFNIKEISTEDIQTYVDSMKNFLSSLLYYGDLISEISKINLNLKSSINISVTADIQKYKEYVITETFNL